MGFTAVNGTFYINGADIGHWTFHVSNWLFLISYIQMNIIIVRLLLLAGSVFYFSFGLFVLHYSIDTTVWNAIHIITHIIYLIPAIKRVWFLKSPTALDNLYLLYFKRMSKDVFLSLFKQAEIISIKDKDVLCKENDKFTSVYSDY
jgi:hypothetical protein